MSLTNTADYTHLKRDCVTDSQSAWAFECVVNQAIRYELTLSDTDFKHFLKLKRADIDISWLMHQMTAYDQSFTDALVSYVTY